MGFRGTLGRSLPSRHSGAALRGAVYFGGGALWGSPLPTRCSSSPCASSICPERSAQPQPPSELHAVPRSSGKPRRYVSHTREPKSRRKRSASPAHWGGGGCVTRDPQILQPTEIPPPPPPCAPPPLCAPPGPQPLSDSHPIEPHHPLNVAPQFLHPPTSHPPPPHPRGSRAPQLCTP